MRSKAYEKRRNWESYKKNYKRRVILSFKNMALGYKWWKVKYMNKLRYIPGDLVYQKDDEGHWNIRSLSALNLALINYKDIKPIPLTSEILEKNGWRKTKIYYKLDLNNHQEVWAYENNDYTYDILVGFKKDDILSTIKEGLKYVSELQNILFGLDLNYGMEV